MALRAASARMSISALWLLTMFAGISEGSARKPLDSHAQFWPGNAGVNAPSVSASSTLPELTAVAGWSVLILALVCVGVVAVRGPPLTQGILACAVYVGFTVVIDISIALQRRGGGSGQYGALEPACVVMTTEAAKLMLSSVLFAASRYSGRSDAQLAPVSLPLADARWLALPGLIFTANNILVWQAIGSNDAATFGIFRDTVILWTAVLWRVVFGVEIGKSRLAAIGVIFLGLVLNKAGHAAGGQAWSWGFLWILVLAFTNSTGSVTNEYALKRVPGQDINLQNMVLYLTCTVCAGLFILVAHPSKVRSPSAFFDGFTRETYFTVIMQAIAGLIVARLLKYADSITKTVASALRGPALVFVAPFFLVSSTDAVSFVSCAIVATGCFAFLHQGPLSTSAIPKCKVEKFSTADDAL